MKFGNVIKITGLVIMTFTATFATDLPENKPDKAKVTEMPRIRVQLDGFTGKDVSAVHMYVGKTKNSCEMVQGTRFDGSDVRYFCPEQEFVKFDFLFGSAKKPNLSYGPVATASLLNQTLLVRHKEGKYEATVSAQAAGK